MPLPRAVAVFNRHVTNKVLGPLAHVASPFALVIHRGRRSGREYKTPVWAFRSEQGFLIALTYGGSRSEWVKNVLADGRATLITRDGKQDVVRPRMVHGHEGLRAMPLFMQPALRILNVNDYLLLDEKPVPSRPMTDEEIQAATVGELKVHGGPIELADYDPEWQELFDRDARRIAAVLGERALGIEHVGSTSVPGLAAKPVIDILLIVVDSGDEEDYAVPLAAAGYKIRIREPDWYEHRLFDGPDTRIGLHVFSKGCPEIDRMLLFRNRLRSNKADRELYERTKRELAQREWKHVQNYADAKAAVIEEIIARARAEVAD
jgi:deazaflavin-dependent oxidoreductase (nitroreductase family)